LAAFWRRLEACESICSSAASSLSCCFSGRQVFPRVLPRWKKEPSPPHTDPSCAHPLHRDQVFGSLEPRRHRREGARGPADGHTEVQRECDSSRTRRRRSTGSRYARYRVDRAPVHFLRHRESRQPTTQQDPRIDRRPTGPPSTAESHHRARRDSPARHRSRPDGRNDQKETRSSRLDARSAICRRSGS